MKQKFFLSMALMTLSLFSSLKVNAVEFQKGYMLNDSGADIGLELICMLPHVDEECEKTIAQLTFGTAEPLEKALKHYADGYQKSRFDAKPRRTIWVTLREAFYNEKTGMLCVSYFKLDKQHLANISKEIYLTYDLKNHKVVELKDLITPALQNHLVSQGVEVDGVTNIFTFGHLYTAKTPQNEVKMTPYKLYKYMTDYALQLVEMDRETLARIEAGGNNAEDPNKVYDVVDKKPEFPGGTENLMAYLSSKLKYPEDIQKQNIHGRVICSFVVGKDGSISNAQILKSVHPVLDREVLRVVNGMPNWQPGMLGGFPVYVRYTLPVTFRRPEL